MKQQGRAENSILGNCLKNDFTAIFIKITGNPAERVINDIIHICKQLE